MCNAVNHQKKRYIPNVGKVTAASNKKEKSSSQFNASDKNVVAHSFMKCIAGLMTYKT